MPHRERPACTKVKYVVDGTCYGSHMGVFREAVARGFNGSPGTVYKRLQEGATTFAVIAKPIPAGRQVSGRAAQSAKQREMQDAIAALDARKRAMGLIP